MATLLVGYDVESLEQDIVRIFLKVAAQIHHQLKAPFTIFLVGKTLENNVWEFQAIKDKYRKLIDFQQHTYSHILFKTVVQENEEGIEVFKGAPLSQIKKEVEKTNNLLKKYLDVNCIGICGPYNYYRGLSDRLDILKTLYDLGIRFTRTYGRNEHDWFPVSMNIQPFWYKLQGFSDILEFPIQGWQDVVWREKYGWNKTKEYLQFVKGEIDYIVSHNLTLDLCQHDWSSFRGDPKMEITFQIIEYALSKGVEVMTHLDYYRRWLRESEKVNDHLANNKERKEDVKLNESF